MPVVSSLVFLGKHSVEAVNVRRMIALWLVSPDYNIHDAGVAMLPEQGSSKPGLRKLVVRRCAGSYILVAPSSRRLS